MLGDVDFCCDNFPHRWIWRPHSSIREFVGTDNYPSWTLHAVRDHFWGYELPLPQMQVVDILHAKILSKLRCFAQGGTIQRLATPCASKI